MNHKTSERTTSDYDQISRLAAEQNTDASFRYEDLYNALNRLPSHERTSILLFYMEGYSVCEIADIQETSQEAIRQLLSRGRKHLKGYLNDKDIWMTIN